MHVAQSPASHDDGGRSPPRRAVSSTVSPAWYSTRVLPAVEPDHERRRRRRLGVLVVGRHRVLDRRFDGMIIILSLCASLVLMGEVAAGAIEVLPIAGGARRRDHRRRPRGRPGRRDRRRDPAGVARAPRRVLPRPDARAADASWRSPARIGEPVEYPFVKGIDGFPEIIAVTKLPHETVNFGGIWHSDTVYLERPPMAHDARRPRGAAVRRRHDVREHVRRVRGALARDAAAARRPARGQQLGAGRRVEDARGPHPRQRRPATTRSTSPSIPSCARIPRRDARRCTSTSRTRVRFVDMTEDESRPLLRFLFEHSVRPEFTCRFRWRVGSVALWDNRCAMHNPVNDYHGHTRAMHRISLAGDVPV